MINKLPAQSTRANLARCERPLVSTTVLDSVKPTSKSTKPMMPMGMLIRKIHLQPRPDCCASLLDWVKTPPTTGPKAAAVLKMIEMIEDNMGTFSDGTIDMMTVTTRL